MVKRIVILLCALHLFSSLSAQEDSLRTATHRHRLALVAGGNAMVWGGSYLALNKAWYAGYPRTKFHFFDDLPEWNQMDKAGHIWTSYQVSRLSGQMWKWAGLSSSTSAVMGGVSGMVYQSIIELQDAYSGQWGFSWSDVGANVIGSGMYVFQQLGWKDQRVQIKLSSHAYRYRGQLLERRNELFGKSAAERILKDYNAQTYWVSANVHSFFPESRWPVWLNVAVGYGAGGMLGGRTNIWTDKNGVTYDYSDIHRSRSVYLSPDIDLTKIRVKSRLVRSVFYVLNMVKIPAPALELSNGRLGFRAVQF